LIALALLLGALAAFVAAKWLGGGEGPQVVMAAQNIAPGHVIADVDLKLVQWPSSDIPNGAATDKNAIVGRVARQAIFPGEAVLESDLAPVGARGGLEAAIEPGKRAITVRVNDVIAVAGFAHPGSYVDVLVSAKDPKGEQFSMIVLNRVKILAIAQETQSDPAQPKVVNAVTLELTPEEAESLDLARNVGSLTLVLRNESDRQQTDSDGVQMKELLQRRIGTLDATNGIRSGSVIEMRGVGDGSK
jgi:pilus assembly protein CpaB